MKVQTIKPPFDVASIQAAWQNADVTSEGSPTVLYRRAIRAIRSTRVTRKKCWPLDAADPSANLAPTARYTGRVRRFLLDRGPKKWLEKSKKAIELWREGSQKRLVEPIRLSDHLDPHNATWLVQMAELQGDRNERTGNIAWARELYLDFLRSANHLRALAPLDQARFACAVEMRMASELRKLAFAKKISSEIIQVAITELDRIWDRDICAKDHFRAEYALQFDETGAPSPFVNSEHAPSPQVARGIQAGLLWFWELCDQPIAARTRILRQQHQAGGTSSMLPTVTQEFCNHFALGDAEHVGQRLKQAEVQIQLRRYVEAIHYFDQCVSARSATRASLIVAAYQKEKGYYPQELATACSALSVETPEDPYSKHGGEIRYIRSPGQRLKGKGIDWPGQRIRTRTGQPIIYSVGADGDDNRCHSVWNRRLTGRGDWVFPLKADRMPRRWLQFDTRTVLCAFTLLAFLFGLRMSPPGRHRAAILAIEKAGGSVEYVDDEQPLGFVENWLGKEYGGTVQDISLSEKENLVTVSYLLPHLQEAKSLDLSSTTLTVTDIQCVSRMRNLTTLNMSGAVFHGDELAVLGSLSKLESIDIGNSQANDVDIAGLSKCATLTSIDAPSTKITGLGCGRLANLPALSRLVLISSPISDAGLAGIGKLTHLEHLDLDSTPINGSGLKHLSSLQNLATIDLRSTQIDDEGLLNLPVFPLLNNVYLQNTNVQGPGLVRLCELPELQSLALTNLKLTDEQLKHLSGLKAISSIDLDGNQIKGPGLQYLSELKELTSLDLSDNPVTNEDKAKLRKALPDLDIDD